MRRFVALAAGLILLLAGGGIGTPASAQKSQPNAGPPLNAGPNATAEKSAAEARQGELRDKLRQLGQSIKHSEAERAEAREALEQSDAAISVVNKSLRDLQQAASDLQRRIAALDRERVRVEAEAARSRDRLGAIVRARSRLGGESQWQSMLSGENPNQIGRDRVYYGYLARAEQDGIAQLQHQSARVAELADQQRDQARQLADTTTAQSRERASLQDRQKERAAILAKISDQVAAQRREFEATQKDAQRLDGLISKLSKQLADDQKRERDRRAAADRERKAQAAQAARPKGSTDSAPQARAEPTRPAPDPELPVYDGNGEFEAGRGKMRWPVTGQLAGRFGEATPGSNGRATYKGWFIQATQGADVKAVAAGRVVFADWLRGFGNLLIIDHGDQYLTIYGGNESLYKQVGQLVKNGETIATVGSTGGTDQTGLYFEMRHRGDPFDPARWLR